MLSDLRLSLRSLSKSRVFALVAILTLAIGIGASTSMFSALRALVISPFSYPEADRLVMVWSGDSWPLSAPDVLDLQEQSTSFTAFGAYQPESVNVGLEDAQAVVGVRGSSGVLRAFGVQPMLGRLFEPSDDAPGAPQVAILSYGLWQQLFAGDPDAIGKLLRVNGGDAQVVGVMPASFEFVSPWMRVDDCQLWLPRTLVSEKMRDTHFLLSVARLRGGVTVATANAEIQAIGRNLTKLYPDSNTQKEFLVRGLHAEMSKDIGKQMWLLFGAVALVLLVACGNVASMLLARSARRQVEFAVRMALGASGGHLVKLALLESFILSTVGAAFGALLAIGGVKILQAYAPVSAARKAAMTLDGGAIVFALVATLLTALLAGLPPALAARRSALANVIRSDARGSVGSRSRHQMLRSLIIVQVAVAFVLANGAVLFSRGYLKLVAENEKLATDAIVTAQVSLHGERYKEDEARVRFWHQFVEEIRTMSGVTHAGITSKLPLEGGSNTNALINDQTYDPTQKRMQVERSSVTEGYLDTMGLRLIKGRGLKPEDRKGDVRGVVVNEELVAQAWPNKEPLGEILRGNNPGKPWYTSRVVGVVENVKQWGADDPVQPEMYTTAEGHWGRRFCLVIRTPLPVDRLTPTLRAALSKIDPELALKDVRTMRTVVDRATQSHRVVAGLVNFFMATALGLVAVGLYGTLSYHVLQRTREIGVRVAIGALKKDIIVLVFAQGGRWIGLGLALGLVGSLALSASLKALVYGMGGLAAWPLLLASTAVCFAGAVACWLPAWRAARLEALEALRSD
jgi:putative ABC transport system permease protein